MIILGIANRDVHDICFFGGLILCYMTGACIAGYLTPSINFSVSNGYGRVLLINAILLIATSQLALYVIDKYIAIGISVLFLITIIIISNNAIVFVF